MNSQRHRDVRGRFGIRRNHPFQSECAARRLPALCLCVFILIGAALGQTNLGPIKTTTQDTIGQASPPANPPSNVCRAYYNTTTGSIVWINSSGASCGPSGGGGGAPGGSACQIQFNNTTFGGLPGSCANGTSGLLQLGNGLALTNLTQGFEIGIPATGLLYSRQPIHSHDFTTSGKVNWATIQAQCPAGPTTCYQILDVGDEIDITSTFTLGASNQVVYVEDLGASIMCEQTSGGCLQISNRGHLICMASGGGFSGNQGCVIGSSNATGNSMVSGQPGQSPNQTNFTLRGFVFNPNCSNSTFDHALLWLNAIEGETDLEDTSFEGCNGTLDVLQDDNGTTNDTNNSLFKNVNMLGNGSTGASCAIVSGTGSGQGSNINMIDVSFGDFSGASNFPYTCRFDGSSAWVTGTVTTSGTNGVNLTSTAGQAFITTGCPSACLWWNEQINVGGVSCSVSSSAVVTATTLTVTNCTPGVHTGLTWYGVMTGIANHALNGINIVGPYDEECSITGCPATHVPFQFRNVRTVAMTGTLIGQGSGFNNLVTISSSGSSQTGSIYITFRGSTRGTCTVFNAITNHCYGDNDMPYFYPGQATTNGWSVDGKATIDSLVLGGPNNSQALTGVQGTTGLNALAATGSFTQGDVLTTDTHGNAVDSGVPVGNPLPTIAISNDTTTGTTLNTLTKIVAGKAEVLATTDIAGIVGITTSGAGTSGTATIQTSGTVNCVFDGATTAGDTVVISTTTRGDCHDLGNALPGGTGIVLSTNASAGTYQIILNLQPGGQDGLDQYMNMTGCSISVGSSCTASGSWTFAFPDGNYISSCAPISLSSSTTGWSITTINTTGLVITVTDVGVNNPGGYSAFHCHGHHN